MLTNLIVTESTVGILNTLDPWKICFFFKFANPSFKVTVCIPSDQQFSSNLDFSVKVMIEMGSLM